MQQYTYLKNKKCKGCLLFESLEACQTAVKEVVFRTEPAAAFLSLQASYQLTAFTWHKSVTDYSTSV